jgi:hypothetical protein
LLCIAAICLSLARAQDERGESEAVFAVRLGIPFDSEALRKLKNEISNASPEQIFAVHVAGASSKLRDPALTRIEYHRSLYHYFRVNRGMGSMATVFTLRLFKTLVYLMLAVPAALLGSERSRARLRMHGDVLAWHLRGCPRSVGFAAASQSAASAAPDPGR